ncbi:hypothetical protein KP509_10G004200 [Ceratopteris richardii]|uniref:Endoplasmic reticulum oxidoreductin-1 n=1 Tax=Ceratopteris richardii TaxID=49495 RepID=A0A8T2TYR6_CERRI|nr:hypothetical protein KP509_10G004200 [Ceratopteris richardii]
MKSYGQPKMSGASSQKKRSGLALMGIVLIATASYFAHRQLTLTFGDGDSSKLRSHKEGNFCEYKMVNSINEGAVYPFLQRLVKTPFFRYFKVKLQCDCPHWADDEGMCRIKDCSVCECPDEEFPDVLKPSKLLPQGSVLCRDGPQSSTVVRSMGVASERWVESRDNPWTFDDETQEDGITYVNLLLNPERFTGYGGNSAHRIWNSIYNDYSRTSSKACVDGAEDSERDLESRVLYKLVSGLHSSISIHIAADYLLDEKAGLWGHNDTLLHERVLKHPLRVRNLYFVYLFVLRAVTKAAEYLQSADYETSRSTTREGSARSEMMEFLKNHKTMEICAGLLDEVRLWAAIQGHDSPIRLQKRFQNISSLMDCVGCEKCRLWGKLQILGLATALDINLSNAAKDSAQYNLHLHRNEAIALINLLNRLSESIHHLHQRPSVIG